MKYILLFLLLLPVSGFASDIDDERERHDLEQPLRHIGDTDPEACQFLSDDLAKTREILSRCCPSPIFTTSCLICDEDLKEYYRKVEQHDCSELKRRKCPDYESLCQDS